MGHEIQTKAAKEIPRSANRNDIGDSNERKEINPHESINSQAGKDDTPTKDPTV